MNLRQFEKEFLKYIGDKYSSSCEEDVLSVRFAIEMPHILPYTMSVLVLVTKQGMVEIIGEFQFIEPDIEAFKLINYFNSCNDVIHAYFSDYNNEHKFVMQYKTCYIKKVKEALECIDDCFKSFYSKENLTDCVLPILSLVDQSDPHSC